MKRPDHGIDVVKIRLVATMAVLAAGASLGLGGVARAAQFLVKPGDGNRVVFASKAPVESFEGKTSRMEGRLTLEPANLGDSITVHLEVDLASLDTGIAKRNQHMRENHLETAKYPKAVFDGAALHGPAGAKLEPGRPVTFDVEGTFTLHGVSRRLRFRAEVTYATAGGGRAGKSGSATGSGIGTLTFRTEFPVALADYNIRRPQFLFLRLGETQQVRVSGVAVEAQ